MNNTEGIFKKIIKSFHTMMLITAIAAGITTGIIFKSAVVGLGMGVGSFIVLSGFNFLIMWPVKKYIQKYSTDIERIKEGDFSLLLNLQNDSSNKMFAKMTNMFGEIIGQFKGLIMQFFALAETIVDSSKKVDDSVQASLISMEQITKTGQEIASGAVQQAEESQNCEQLMENLSKEITAVYDNYHVVTNQTIKISELSDAGSHSLEVLRQKTADTEKSTEKISVAVETLTDKIKDISMFVDSIENIATQTNLLALNAAIEAARAGEAGRGFGVVAEEIRKLADESRKSTEEIKNLVHGIQEQSQAAVQAMEMMSKVSDEEAHAVSDTDEAFKDITAGIRLVTEKISHTNDSILKVNKDKEKVRQAISHISAVSQTTAAQTEEVASTIESQADSMEKMKQATHKLNTIVGEIDEQLKKYRI